MAPGCGSIWKPPVSLGKEAPDSQSPSGGNDKDQTGVPGDKGHMGLKCFHLVMMMGGSRVVERHTGRKVLILSLIEALVTACPCSNVAEPRRDDKPCTFPSEAGCTASSSFSRAHRGPGAEQQRCPGAPGAPRSQGPLGATAGRPVLCCPVLWGKCICVLSVFWVPPRLGKASAAPASVLIRHRDPGNTTGSGAGLEKWRGH